MWQGERRRGIVTSKGNSDKKGYDDENTAGFRRTSGTKEGRILMLEILTRPGAWIGSRRKKMLETVNTRHCPERIYSEESGIYRF